MRIKDLILTWVEFFNQGDYKKISEMYSEDSTNYQVPNEPVSGKFNIEKMFKEEFESYDMTCIVENIFVDNNVGILEWKDPNGLRGCGFFWFQDNKIVYQRGYWNKKTFEEKQCK